MLSFTVKEIWGFSFPALQKVQDDRVAVAPNTSGSVCGFIVEPDSETLSIPANAGLTELVTGRGFERTRSTQDKKPGRFANYMVINLEEVVKSFDVIHDPEVSDHCPLVLRL
jgi:hypothetical protein